MTDETLTPERAVRLLRAKAGELEAEVLAAAADEDALIDFDDRTADIALIATLLADHIEWVESTLAVTTALLADESERMDAWRNGINERLGQIDADLWTRLDALERYCLADAEHGVRGDPASMAPLVEARRDLLAQHHQQQRRNWPQQYPEPTWPVENQPQQGDTP